VFCHELTFGVIAPFLFWPAGFILSPDFVFNFEEQQKVKNGHQNQNASPNSRKKSNGELSDSFPVDDESPITSATFINKCVEQCPKTSNFFQVILSLLPCHTNFWLHFLRVKLQFSIGFFERN